MISPRIFGCLSMACLTSASPSFAILYLKDEMNVGDTEYEAKKRMLTTSPEVFSQQNQKSDNKLSRPRYPDDILKHNGGSTFWTGRTLEGRCYQDSGTKLHIVCTSHFIFQHGHLPSLSLLRSNSDYHCTTEPASHCVHLIRPRSEILGLSFCCASRCFFLSLLSAHLPICYIHA